MSGGNRLLVLLVGVLSAGALAPGLAFANAVSTPTVAFCADGCSSDQASSPAGAQAVYDVTFTLTDGFSSDTYMTIQFPQGTVLPSTVNSYEIDDLDGAGSSFVMNAPGASTDVVNNNATVVMSPHNGLTFPSGTHIRVRIGFSGNQVTNPTTAGTSYTADVWTGNDPDHATSNPYSIVPDRPTSFQITGGSNQSATVGTAFTDPLQVTLTDQYSNPISGAQIDWSLPASGSGIATGAFPVPPATTAASATTNTNSSGVAESPAVTAGTVAGQWQPTATLDSDSTLNQIFNLTNLPGIGHDLTLGLAPDTISADGSSTTTATATVKDADANPVPGETVAFSAPDGSGVQVGSTTDNGDGTYSATITAPGRQTAGDVTITASDTSSSDHPGDGQTLHLTADTTPPSLTIDSAPASVIHSATARVGFHSADATATFKCRLDAGAAKGCASPYSRHSLDEGRHKITVTATDAAGNSGEPAVESFIIDAHKPQVSINGPRKTKDRTPTFKLKPSEDDVKLKCKLGSGAYKPCGHAFRPHRLVPGSYALKVRVTDAAGSESTAKRKFKIER